MATYDLKYPGAAIDAILDTAYDLQNAGYIFRGLASEYSNTPSERSWVLAGEGETGHGFTTAIPKGYIGVCVFDGTSWTGKLVKCVSIDSAPTPGSTNAVSSGGAYAALNQLATGVAEALDNMQFTDVTPPADEYTQLKLKMATTDSGIERIITYLTFLSATTSKAGLLSAADKAKLDAILGNLRSLEIDDTTAYADLGDKIVESIKATIGGTEETISTFHILAATASKAGLLSAADKAKLDALWSSGYQFAGIATPSTTPISTISKIFYIATEAGTYFNAVTVTQGINILSWDGSAWSAVQVIGIDNVPTDGSDNLVKSGGVFGELALGAVYDVSAKNPTAGPNSDGKWESLSALLSDANLNTLIPTAVRKGGMSIKFVQTSDNKYVRYNLLADEFTTDTTQWAIAEEGVYVDNPEFVYVKTDKDNKILWAIRTDGDIYYGAGCPQQVKDYIKERISQLSLDEYEDIVAFLSDYLGSDTTLKVMIDGINASKVDKEEGKSLIDAEYASTKSSIENPEFLEVTKDSEDKVLEGIREDGTKVIGGDLNVEGSAKILGEMEVAGVAYKVVKNSEYLAAWVDAEDKVIFGLKADGKTYVGDADFLNDIDDIKAFLQNITDKNIDWDALSSITAVENPEFIEAKTDSEDKVLEGIKADGTKVISTDLELNARLNQQGVITEIVDSSEYLEAKVDAEGKLIEGINKNGEKIFGVIPPQIKQYIDENIPAGSSGVSNIEYDENTGDMYATYDDESGVTDVYMEPDGDIYVESEE